MTKPTRTEAMMTKCWDCCHFYIDGKLDCEVTKCPLYTYMPYRRKEPDLELFRFNPKHVGKQTFEETKRDMSEEQRLAMSERMKKLHKKGKQ